MVERILASFLPALFGAVLQEVLHWYYLRNKLDSRKYKVLLKRTNYWLITSLMVLLSAIGTAWFYGTRLEQLEIAVLGAAFPDIFRKLITSAKQGEVTLGEDVEESTADLYFS